MDLDELPRLSVLTDEEICAITDMGLCSMEDWGNTERQWRNCEFLEAVRLEMWRRELHLTGIGEPAQRRREHCPKWLFKLTARCAR